MEELVCPILTNTDSRASSIKACSEGEKAEGRSRFNMNGKDSLSSFLSTHGSEGNFHGQCLSGRRLLSSCGMTDGFVSGTVSRDGECVHKTFSTGFVLA